MLPEIQALRAIAVLGVIGFHLWPERLTGGYVGVDVFFVISGYLIIGHLVRRPDVSLGQFWARRARRLLPASLLVLAVTGITTYLLLPQIVWRQWFQEIAAAGAYVENWLLALNSVDYLGAENSASPVQHYWSLSVEEQFYVVWPILILLVVACFRKNRTQAILGLLAVVATASLVYSIISVLDNDPAAYFSTLSRAWEFGIGGILAIVGAHNAGPRTRLAVSALGLATIAASMFTFTKSTPFPGALALVPVVGAIAVIWAGEPIGLSRVMRWRPVQWIGDVSYSTYLWHWPPIVILPLLLGGELTMPMKVLILAGSLALGGLTKQLVEDPIRNSVPLIARPAWVTLAAAGMVGLLVAGSSGLVFAQMSKPAVVAVVVPHSPCVGAAALSCAHPYRVEKFTDPVFAETDIGVGVLPDDACKQDVEDPTVIICEKGDTTRPTATIALVGDSHAGQYLVPLDLYGRSHGLKIVAYLKSWCAGTGVDGVAAAHYDTESAVGSCARWGKDVLADVAADKTIATVVFANFTYRYTAAAGSTHQITAADFQSAWSQLPGKTIVALRDNPSTGGDIPKCVALHMREYDPCTFPLPVYRNPMLEAASAEHFAVVDMDDILCSAQTCHAVIGGLVVYFGSHHFTSMFASTLAPYIGDRIIAASPRA